MGYDLSKVQFSSDYIWERSVFAPNGCIIWAGALDSKGYGLIARKVNGKRLQIKAHRASWLARHGAAGLDKLCVLHRCDVPACVNPEHLFLGTKTDNARDRDAKGRGKLWRGGPLSNARKLVERAMDGQRDALAIINAVFRNA